MLMSSKLVSQMEEVLQASSALLPEVTGAMTDLSNSVSSAVDLAIQVCGFEMDRVHLADCPAGTAYRGSRSVCPFFETGAQAVRYREVPGRYYCHLGRSERYAPLGPDWDVYYSSRRGAGCYPPKDSECSQRGPGCQ
jgi:hypothetical protein